MSTAPSAILHRGGQVTAWRLPDGSRVPSFPAIVQNDNGVRRGLPEPLWSPRIVLENTPVSKLESGDALCCRGGDGLNREFITLSGGGPYYHIAMFYWWDAKNQQVRTHQGIRQCEPWVVEMVEPDGGRKLPWGEWKKTRDDTVDVYRPSGTRHHQFDHVGAANWMLENIAPDDRVVPYGFDVIRRFARQQSWITCWWNRPNSNPQDDPPTSWVCSTSWACAAQYGGGLIPIPVLWPGDAMPVQVARARINTYQFSFSRQGA